MSTMYSNLTKSQAFPLAIRFSSQPRCFKQFQTSKPQFLSTGSYSKPSLNPIFTHFNTPSHDKKDKSVNFVRPTTSSFGLMGSVGKPGSVSSGFRVRIVMQCSPLIKARSFSSSYSQRVGERRSGVVRAGKTLPWLASNKAKEGKRLEKVSATKTSSSWEESAKRLEKSPITKAGRSTWEESVGTESRNRMLGTAKDWQNDNIERCGSFEDEKEEDGEEEEEVVDDPRWDKIKNRFRGTVDVKAGFEKPEVRRWNKQENWGKRTWKEANDSTVPKMVGEGVYGVGPVLAALSAGRREFYALYVQEGLDLSSNNRKKKDKKGFEKVLKMAEKIGLSIKEASKHDLNMVIDNRPHQGLVLDASPLEMVKIKELDPVSVEEDKGTLWVALDEIMDPQNLGAIIRSAYFFGASGVVLCAKNSAPLSGVVSKASAGSLELMELRYCKNMMQFLTSSAENGWRVLGGSVSSKAVPLNEVLPGAPTILVLGSEGTGLRPLVERSCTQLVRIPGNIPVDVTTGGVDDLETTEVNSGCSGEEFRYFLAVESLNVSVAAGVLLHHLIGNNHNDNCDSQDKPTESLE